MELKSNALQWVMFIARGIKGECSHSAMISKEVNIMEKTMTEVQIAGWRGLRYRPGDLSSENIKTEVFASYREDRGFMYNLIRVGISRST